MTNMSTAMTPYLQRDHYGSIDTYQHLIAPDAIAYTASRLRAMLDADPWLSASWPIQPGSGSDAEKPLSKVLASHTTDITDMPWGGGVNLRMYSMGGGGGGGVVADIMAMKTP